MQVEVPDQMRQGLQAGMKAAGIPVPDSEERWADALKALEVLHHFPLLLCHCVDFACFLLCCGIIAEMQPSQQ
jgi:hypothetical protein